jgi:hypothetical protein
VRKSYWMAHAKGTVGFALTSLQRRLASSPEAIYQSLRRRRQKLTRRVEEEKLKQRGQMLGTLAGDLPNAARNLGDDDWDPADSLGAEDYEIFEEAVTDQATAAQTIQELEAEILSLRNSGRPCKASGALWAGSQMG